MVFSGFCHTPDSRPVVCNSKLTDYFVYFAVNKCGFKELDI